MAHWITPCEWCGKKLDFHTEEKKQHLWYKCDSCNAKMAQVEMNDCYEEIKQHLENGNWVVGKRVLDYIGFSTDEYVVFLFLTQKGFIKASHSRNSIKGAIDDLFSTVWSDEEIKKFGFSFLKEMKPITTISEFKGI
jgi:hypothetical protein